MTNPRQPRQFLGINHRAALTALTGAFLLVLIIISLQPAQAQTFTVLHSFSGHADGAYPSGLTIDVVGNLYGTTAAGGDNS